MDVLTRIESRAVRVYPQQCSKLRHRRSSCTLCADYCPAQAITWGESLQVDPDECTGCGMCAAVCPTGALEAQAPTNVELLTQIQERVKEGASVAFACPRYLEAKGRDGDHFIQVNCIGRLDESILVGTVAEGAQAAWLMDEACQECPYVIGRAVAEQVVQKANGLLQAFGVQERIFIGRELPPRPGMAAQPPAAPAASEGLSRRAFFSLLTRETTRMVTVTVDSVLSSQGAQIGEGQTPVRGELPVRVPTKHQLLLRSLRKLGRPAQARSPVSGWPFAQVTFTGACTGCAMCSFFCPTGALGKQERGDQVTITFQPAQCTACGLCCDICYQDAIEFSEPTLELIIEDGAQTLWQGRLLSPQERIQQAMAQKFESSSREISRER